MAAHQLADVTVVADAGMVSEGNRNAIEDAWLCYIIGARIPQVPYQVLAWRTAHTNTNGEVEDIPDGHVFTQPWPATQKQKTAGRRNKVTYCRYSTTFPSWRTAPARCSPLPAASPRAPAAPSCTPPPTTAGPASFWPS